MQVLEAKKSILLIEKPLTVPMSPAIQKPKPKPAPAPEPSKLVKANPVPDLSKAFVPEIKHRVVEPSSFTLPGDVIHSKRRTMIEKKKQEEEKALARQRQFKANPIALPEKVETMFVLIEKVFEPEHSGKMTEPAPFNLNTEKRGAKHKQQFLDQLEKEKEQELKAKEFHAQQLPEAEPFIPARSNKPLTEIQTFKSHLEMRMEERKAFEEEQRRKAEEEAASKAEFEATMKVGFLNLIFLFRRLKK